MYDDDYFLEFYKNVQVQINGLTDRVSLKTNKSPASLRWTDFKAYFSNKYDIDYIEYPFKSSLQKRLSGSIKMAGDCAIIGYNGSMSPSRQRFSQAHETGHFFDSLV
ncbi:ImmA/IrrE family metallo-endopeptidase, partial [Acinetobacter ursingii]